MIFSIVIFPSGEAIHYNEFLFLTNKITGHTLDIF